MSAWRACTLCHFQSTLQTCSFFLSHHFIGSHRKCWETVKKKEIKLTGGMLSKTYPITWFSVDSVWGVEDVGVSKFPSAILYLTLTLSCNEFLSTVYHHLYQAKPIYSSISEVSTCTRTSMTLPLPYSFAIVLINISRYLTRIIYTYILLIRCQALFWTLHLS